MCSFYKPLITTTFGDKRGCSKKQACVENETLYCLLPQKESKRHTEITLPLQRRPHRTGWGLPLKLKPSMMSGLGWAVKKEILPLCFAYLPFWRKKILVILFNLYICNNSLSLERGRYFLHLTHEVSTLPKDSEPSNKWQSQNSNENSLPLGLCSLHCLTRDIR